MSDELPPSRFPAGYSRGQDDIPSAPPPPPPTKPLPVTDPGAGSAGYGPPQHSYAQPPYMGAPADPVQRRSVKPWLVTAAAVLTCVVLVAAVIVVVVNWPDSPVASQPSTTTTESAPTTAQTTAPVTDVQTTVDANGFTATVDGATVSGPAGVAPVGTSVRVRTLETPVPDTWADFAKPVASGVTVELADGRQPDAPITISFPDVQAAQDVFVLSQSGDGAIEVVGEAQASGPVSVTTQHLSGFWPILVDISNLADKVFSAASDALQITTARPDCFVDSGEYPDLGLRISGAPTDVVWPCLTGTTGSVALSLASNSGVAWQVATDPVWQADPPVAYSAANILALSTWRTAAGAVDEVLLLPGEGVSFQSESPPESTTVEMTVDPAMSQVRTLALAANIVFPASAMEKIGRAECLPDLVRSGAIDGEPSASLFGAIFRCFGAAIGGAAGALVGLLAAAPAALWTELEGVLRSATRQDVKTFTIESIDDPAPPPDDDEPVDPGDPVIDRVEVFTWAYDRVEGDTYIADNTGAKQLQVQWKSFAGSEQVRGGCTSTVSIEGPGTSETKETSNCDSYDPGTSLKARSPGVHTVTVTVRQDGQPDIVVQRVVTILPHS